MYRTLTLRHRAIPLAFVLACLALSSIAVVHAQKKEAPKPTTEGSKPTTDGSKPTTPPKPRINSTYLETLNSHSLELTAESLRGYLESLHPTDELAKRVAVLIQQLGDDDFFRREAATKQLIQMNVKDHAQLQAAATGDDLEIRWRAKQVLKLSGTESAKLLYAVFSVISSHEIKGLAQPVTEAFPMCQQQYVKQAARRALLGTVQPADADYLRTVVGGKAARVNGDLPARMAAVSCLEQFPGELTNTVLQALLSDSSHELQLEACRVLINQKQRRVLPQLAELLKSDSLLVRRQSSHILRAATGQRFRYSAYAKEAERAVAVKQWQDWIATNGATADLQLPLERTPALLGRTLMTNYTKREAFEVDLEGNKIWNASMTGVWGCRGLPNGHRLVASYTGKQLAEYDSTGQKIWDMTLKDKPYFITRLGNGNILTACYNKQIMEIRPDKTIAWELMLPERCKYAIRLENGNTLCAFYDKSHIVEITKTGKVVRDFKTGHSRPYAMQLLPNGNVLVSYRTSNIVVEADQSGKVLWTYSCPSSLYQAQRLPDGNTLMCGQFGAIEVKPDKSVVWKYAGSLRGIHRY